MLPVVPSTATRIMPATPSSSRPSRNAGPAARQAVDAVEHAAVARQQRAAVLHARAALEHALGEVADHRDAARPTQADGQPRQRRVIRAGAPSQPPRAMRPASPPSTPSQVLPGLTRGASLWRPKRRPPKNAPMSAAAISTSRNSSSVGRSVRSVDQAAERDGRRHQHEQAGERRGGPADRRAGRGAIHTRARSHHAAATSRNAMRGAMSRSATTAHAIASPTAAV